MHVLQTCNRSVIRFLLYSGLILEVLLTDFNCIVIDAALFLCVCVRADSQHTDRKRDITASFHNVNMVETDLFRHLQASSC